MLKKSLCIILFFYCQTMYATSIILKSGGIIKGKIISQDGERILIIDQEGNNKTIPKSSILKTVYKESNDQELLAIKKEEERKLVMALQKKSPNQKETQTIPSMNSRKWILTPKEGECFFHASNPEWFWFYGNYSITNEDEWKQMLPDDARPIHVIFKSSWVDTSLTLLVGSLTSISRKTRVIEVCEI
ncbi:MAG: hypothetical protein CK427_16615 [Leptospira sp.]|nr:MAG: hypothetical protein CK427_16615 [Leptospira sp.]